MPPTGLREGMDQLGAQDELVDINGYEVDLSQDSPDYDKIAELRHLDWVKAKWHAAGAWLFTGPNGSGRVKGTSDRPLQDDAIAELGLGAGTEMQFDPRGWTVDHCAVCVLDITETDDVLQGEAWNHGDLWVCDECYRLLVAPDAVFSTRFPEDGEAFPHRRPLES